MECDDRRDGEGQGVPVHQGDDSFEAIGQAMRDLRGDKTQAAVAKRLRISQAAVSLAEQGIRITVRTAALYDRLYNTGGALATRTRNVARALKWGSAASHPGATTGPAPYQHGDLAALVEAADGFVVLMPLPGVAPEPRQLADIPDGRSLALPDGLYRVITSGVSPADRRNFFYVASAPLVTGVLGEVEEASRAITAGQPDPWTLAELAEDSVTIAARYWSTPLDQLLPEVITRWRQCRNMLEQSLIGKTCEQVIRLAGTYAYYAARIGYHTGDRRLASGFGTLAEQYAEISEDPLLIGSVAGFRSFQAFDAARYAEAADVAGGATRIAHPYNRARLFAYQARALAAGGHPDQARDALAEMRAHMVNLPRMPGAGLFDDGGQLLYSAMVLVDIGDRGAEAFAREAIAGVPADDCEARGLACTTLGGALASRDPGAAADSGLRAIEMNRAWPSIDVERRIRNLHRTLARDHGDVAEVIQLGEACRELRPAGDA